MSVYAGPEIANDGLVLCLDAANPKSYPGSGTTWTDLSGNGNNGTLQNDPSYNTENFGNFSLDGSNDRILISCNNSTIRTFNSTTQFIVKLPVYSGGQRCILSYRTGAGLLYIGKSNNGIFCFYNQLSTSAFTVGNIASNQTVICTITCDATNNLLSTYINGTLAGSASRTGWVSTYHTSLYLGWDAGGTNEYMLGNFYQFSHYNRVLTASEVQQNFNATRSRYGI
jgi:hypothetical protein